MTPKLSDIPSSCEIPNSHCYFQYEKNGKIFSGEYPLGLILFGGDIDGYTHQGYVTYLAGKIEGFSENIQANNIHYQGLVNCLIKGLIPRGQDKSQVQLQKNLDSFESDLEFLYGILGDVPEILEKQGNPQNISISALRARGESDISEKRAYQKGEKYTTQLLSILDNEGADTDEIMQLEVQKYCIKSYGKGNTPNKEKLESLGVSADIITMIGKFGTTIKIQAIIEPNETHIGEFEGYQIVEMHSIEHLEKESEITQHCVGESDHYIRKINNGKVRIFSLRKGDSRMTLEYDVKNNKFIQMQGSDNKLISLIELDKVLKLFSEEGFKNISFEYSEVQELCEKDSFIIGYSYSEENSTEELIVEDYNDVSQLEKISTVGGKIVLGEGTTHEELERLCKLPIDLDITSIEPELKNSIIYIRGGLIDFSDRVEMNSLQSVGGNLDSPNAEKVLVNRLQSVWGYFNCKYAQIIEMDSLQSVGGNFNCENAERVEINTLKSVGGNFECFSARVIRVNKIKSVLGNFYCAISVIIETNSLEYVGKSFNCSNSEIIQMNNLQSVGGHFGCGSAKKIEMNNLESVWGNFICNGADIIEVNSLQSVGGHFLCLEAKNIEMNSLQLVGGHFSCLNAKEGNLSRFIKAADLTLPKGSKVILAENSEFEIISR